MIVIDELLSRELCHGQNQLQCTKQFMSGKEGRVLGGMDHLSRSGWHHHINTISIIVVGNDDIKKNGLIHSLYLFL